MRYIMNIKRLIIQEKDDILDITEATLLTIEQAESLPIRLRAYPHKWWLRSHGDCQFRVATIDDSGSIRRCGNFVDHCYFIRPALLIKSESSNLNVGDNFIFKGKVFEVVSKTLAFCKTDIGRGYFRENWEGDDVSEYEFSDIKKYIDDWFAE